jgi:hypothetical protein
VLVEGGKEEEVERHPVPCGGGGRRRTVVRCVASRATALGCGEPEVGDEAGGPNRAGLGRDCRVATRPKGFFLGLQNYFSNFSNKDLILKAKDSNTFKPNLNWNQTEIN